MTWMTTWPDGGIPQYAEHDSEARAARHADQIVASRRAEHATYFEADEPLTVHERHTQPAQSDAGAEVAPIPTETIRLPNGTIQGDVA